MGVSDPIIIPFYKQHINNVQPTALLGFDNNSIFDGDLYDIKRGNWDINSKWELDKKYKTIICTRCAYFAKDPKDMILRCFNNLCSKGYLYIDWGIGDHWRFSLFKVGWIKSGEHEFAYGKDNYLWSGIWDDSLLNDGECSVFQNEIKKRGYGSDLKRYIYEEIPSVIEMSFIKKYFQVEYRVLTIINPLSMYVLIKGQKLE